MIFDLPVVYNFIDFGEISDDAVYSLDVTTVKATWFATQLLGNNQATYLCIHMGGSYGWYRLGHDLDTKASIDIVFWSSSFAFLGNSTGTGANASLGTWRFGDMKVLADTPILREEVKGEIEGEPPVSDDPGGDGSGGRCFHHVSPIIPATNR